MRRREGSGRLEQVKPEPRPVEGKTMEPVLIAAAVIAVVLAVAAASFPVIAWVDGRSHGITANRSRVNSSVQAVVTTAAFATAYAVHPGDVPATGIALGVAVLFGLALGGEIQAERLHRLERAT